MSEIQEKLSQILREKSTRNYVRGLKEHPNLISQLSTTYGNLTLKELFYCGLNNIQPPTCQHGNIPIFKNLNDGYRQYCGVGKACKCRQQNQSTKIKKNYNALSDEEKLKREENRKNACLKKYGVDNHMKTNEYKQKFKDMDHTTRLNKSKAAYKKKTGFDTPLENPKVQQKSRNTHLDKYGGLMVTARKDLYEKYNGNPFSDKNIQQKIKAYWLQNFGVEHPLQIKEIRDKVVSTNQERYNRKNASQKHIPVETIELFENKEAFTSLISNSSILGLAKKFKVSEKFVANKYSFHNIPLPGRSSYEEQFKSFFIENNISFIQNCRTILDNRYELDFYLPTYNTAFKICGLYYHSEFSLRGKPDRKYHYNKWKQCQDKGITLYTFFEDEIIDIPDIVFNRISHLLKFNNSSSIGARHLTINEISWKEAKLFLNQHHLQGHHPSSKFKYGAFYGDKLVAVMLFSRNPKGNYDLELTRFATDEGKYPGIASRLFKRALGDLAPNSVVSFSDNRHSKGEIYKILGFNFDGQLKEGYYYTDYRTRYEKTNFRKSKLKNIGFDPDKWTEFEAIRSLGLDRIWDCGKVRWVWRKK